MRGKENLEFDITNAKDGQLTSSRLSRIPQRNVNGFLLDYVQNQRRFLKQYSANEMDTVTSNQQGQETSVDKIRSSEKSKSQANANANANLFGTPILKARVPINNKDVAHKPLKTPTDPSCEKALPHAEVRRASKPQGPRDTTTEQRKVTADRIEKIKKGAKKRTHKENADSDNEETQRLEERQERKRAKKNIIQPPEQEKAKSSSKQKSSSKKAPTGFALMHGFCATNVGKNRLTLDPIKRDVGFFKKGKASDAATIIGKKVKAAEIQFSETKFLKGTKANRKPSGTLSQAASEDSDSLKQGSSLIDRTGKEPANHKSSTILVGPSQDATDKVARVPAPYNPADSVVWDIEKDTELSLCPVNSEILQGSITVKMPRTHEMTPVNVNDKKAIHPALLVSSPSIKIPPDSSRDNSSSISLGPSQSASQAAPAVFLSAKKAARADSTSKYFNNRQKPGELPIKETIIFAEEEQAVISSDHPHLSGSRADVPQEVGIAESALDSVSWLGSLSIDHVGKGLVALQDQEAHPRILAVLASETGDTSVAGNWLLPDACNSDELGSLYEEFHDPFYEVRHREDSDYGDYNLRAADVTDSWTLGLDDYSDLELPSVAWYNDAQAEFVPAYDNNMESILSHDSMVCADYSDIGFVDQPRDLDIPHADNTSETYSVEGLDFELHEQVFDSGRHDSELELDVSDCEKEEECRYDGEFCQGRLLLSGFDSPTGHALGIDRIRDVEVEVAVGLKTKHWLPQRLGV